MENEAERLPVLRLARQGASDAEEAVAREFPLTVILNNQELVTLLCSPSDLRYLAVGFLLSEGLLESKDDIRRITVDDRRGLVRVDTREDKEQAGELLFKRLMTSGCGRGATFHGAADAQSLAKVESETRVTVPEVFGLVKEFQHHSRLYLATHGVHSAALYHADILVFAEDIGRHNAIDKVFGRCLLEDIPTDGRIVVTSGRVSSEILLKVARRNIPVVISISAPTDVAVELAGDLGVTLVCSVTRSRMNVFTHDRRVVPEEAR